MTVLLTADEILATRVAIDPVFLHPPTRHPALDHALGCAVTMKVETLNPIRSFKGRGTELVLASLEPAEAVVTASSGNFGQGIAWAARRRGIAATIFAPVNANPMKVRAHAPARGGGASGRERQGWIGGGQRSRSGKDAPSFIEDGAHREIAAGAGTIAQEMTAAGVRPDVVLVQIGDGALVRASVPGSRRPLRGHQWLGATARNAPAMAESSPRGGRSSGLPSLSPTACRSRSLSKARWSK